MRQLSGAHCWRKEEKERILPERLFPQWKEGDGMPGQNPALDSPAMSPCPRAVNCRSWPVARSCWPSCQGLLARRRWLVVQGPGKLAGTEMLGEWIFSVLGTTLQGRSVTRWSRGRHLSNKHRLHKITAWVIAFLSSLHTKPSGK